MPNDLKAFKLRIYISLKSFFGLSIGLNVELYEKKNPTVDRRACST